MKMLNEMIGPTGRDGRYKLSNLAWQNQRRKATGPTNQQRRGDVDVIVSENLGNRLGSGQ